MNAQLDTAPVYQRDSCHEVIDEIKPLLEQHWREIAHYQDIPPNVDFDAYFKAERDGKLRIFTVRSAGALIGYALFFVAVHPRYRDSLQAHQDVLYLDPCFRKGRVGMRFIAWCDEQLQAEGVQIVYQHIKADPAKNFGPLLERLGYELIDEIWGCRLDMPEAWRGRK